MSLDGKALRFVCGGLVLFAAGAAHGASPAPIRGEDGMVVSAGGLAGEVGLAVLRDGGNAIDAAVAVGFALAVTHPSAGNIGGGGFLVAHMADGTTFTLDFREKAPGSASRDMYLDEEGTVVEGLSLYTALASGVPGSVDGLLRVLEDYGSGAVSRRRAISPAIRLARKGFGISRFMAEELNRKRDYFAKDEGASAIFVRDDGEAWEAGDVLRQADLAKTLKRIARRGAAGFYEGETADLIVAEMERRDGILSRADLAAYESVYREAMLGDFMGHEIVSMPPPSSGGVLLIHMLKMLELLEIDEHGWNSAAYVHRLTEVERLAYADRAKHLGDLDYWDVPIAGLLSDGYAAERATRIDLTKATPSSEVGAGAPAGYESPETTHYSVIDKDGNAVSVTTTLNLGYGSGIVVDGAGFLLNNEMDDFSAKPGTPNAYGLVGAEANAIQPGKRMLSSMTPTIVLRDGKPVLVTGTPGGSTIITSVMQVVLNVLVHDMDVQEAVDAPRVHSQWLPDKLYMEERALPADTIVVLEGMGHDVEGHSWRSIGRAHSIRVRDGYYFGAADSRGPDAKAAGY